MNMKQEEIVSEIRRMCGNVQLLPLFGWHFKYNGQLYFYIPGNDESMIRFYIPFVEGVPLHKTEQLKEAVNDTNRNVKFIKALLSENEDVKVSLDYDHKISEKESVGEIVPHIIKALDFAASYLVKRMESN